MVAGPDRVEHGQYRLAGVDLERPVLRVLLGEACGVRPVTAALTPAGWDPGLVGTVVATASGPVSESVTARLNFFIGLRVVDEIDVPASESADFDILTVGFCRLITRAPAAG